MVFCYGLDPDEFPGVPNHGEQEDGTWPPVFATNVFLSMPLCVECMRHIVKTLTEIAGEQLREAYRS
jgi:hypothetical protein